MALSNVFREPRRELIEQAIGTIALSGAIAADAAIGYATARWLGATPEDGSIVIATLGLAAIGPMVVYVFLLVCHQVGEDICAKLARAGFDPRPRRRC